MEINLFSKCIKELIVENDRVDVPYLGTFTAEMRPASYSDRQTTINPPYRKMSFHKHEVSLSEGRLLLDKVRREAGVNLDQAGVELGWCLSRLCSELEGSKSCKLPGLGVMRANSRNEFFFVPNDDLDIWPDGLGFEPISIKISEKIPGQAGNDIVETPVEAGNDNVETPVEVGNDKEPSEEIPGQAGNDKEQPEKIPGQAGNDNIEAPVEVGNDKVQSESHHDSHHGSHHRHHHRRRMRTWKIVLIVVAVLLVLFIAASYLFTEQMSPILDPLLYSKEELELLGR